MAAHLLPTCDTTVTAIVTAIDTTTYVGDPNVHTQIIASDQFDAEVQASERGKVAAGMAVHQMTSCYPVTAMAHHLKSLAVD